MISLIFIINIEPVAANAPKVMTGGDIKVISAEIDQNLNILCPAQGFPTPIYRLVVAYTNILFGPC